MWWFGVALAGGSAWEVSDEQVVGALEWPSGSLVSARVRMGPLLALNLEDEAAAAEFEAALRAERGDDATPERERARVLRADAIDLRRRLLDPRDPDALAGLAYALEEAGRPAEAIVAWRALLAAAPEDRHAAHARLYLAERAFESADLGTAATGYATLLADPTLGDYAAYKLAWCDYNLGRFQSAADRFAALAAKGTGLLHREARRDLTAVAARLVDAEVERLVAVACAVDSDRSCVADTLRRVDERRLEDGLPPVVR